MFRIEGVSAGYQAGRPAVHSLDLEVSPSKVATLIGANGVGKTTALKASVGQLSLMSGRRYIDGRDVTKSDAVKMLKHGLALVPEGRGILAGLTVDENLQLGAYTVRSKKAARSRYDELLKLFPSLEPRLKISAGLLSGGEQQMLAIARALMPEPRYLLLDEPSMGLAPKIVQHVAELLRQLADDQGLGILLVEQNATMALSIADHAYVMEHGTITHSGAADELRSNDKVRRAYLGVA